MPRRKHCVILDVSPQFALNNVQRKYVSEFRYLGHIINDKLHDHFDIQSAIRHLFVQTN